ncbi:hypothetical protein DICVIV_13655 [Dictyocaulus viviparus]|uniref:Uncharacterized protein n=1 Tax=Dictyocaulus viviparus TaxID=29172 RepID=A0A0D8X9E1_DICVI|nr:hypothetical protein DICVIV_13655 [Dictyocaulus viviparus]
MKLSNWYIKSSTASIGGYEKNHCFVVGNTVASLCTKSSSNLNNGANFAPIPANHLTINGALRISDELGELATDDVWPLVLNRLIRTLSSGPFGAHFYGATVVTK